MQPPRQVYFVALSLNAEANSLARAWRGGGGSGGCPRPLRSGLRPKAHVESTLFLRGFPSDYQKRPFLGAGGHVRAVHGRARILLPHGAPTPTLTQ